MSAVVFDIDARAEFLAAVAFYEDCQGGLGRRFRELVEAEIDAISFPSSPYAISSVFSFWISVCHHFFN